MFIKWFPEYWISNVVIEYISHNASVGLESKSEYLSFCCSHNLCANTERNTRTHTHTIWIELKTAGFFLAILNDSEWEKQRNLSECNRNLLEWWAKAFRQKSDLNWNCVRVLFIILLLAHKTIIFDYNWVWVAVNFFFGERTLNDLQTSGSFWTRTLVYLIIKLYIKHLFG